MAWTEKNPGSYMLQTSMCLPSGMSIDRARRAWAKVVKSLELLRTRIIEHDGEILQAVLKESFDWVECDSFHDYLQADRQRQVTFGSSLSRFALTHHGPDASRWLIWSVHHALFDSWSMSLIMEALNDACNEQLIGDYTPFTPFIQHLSRIDGSKMESYWQKYLQGCSKGDIFPNIRQQSSASETNTILRQSLGELRSPYNNITVSSMIRAAWALVAGQASASSSVVFGATVFGRAAAVANIEEIAAPTFATVPVFIELRRDEPVQGYICRVHHESLEMMPYEQTGLHRISKLSAACRSACSFQTLLIVQSSKQKAQASSNDKFRFDWDYTEHNQERWFNPCTLMLEVYMSENVSIAKPSFDFSRIKPGLVQNLLHRLEHTLDIFRRPDICQSIEISSFWGEKTRENLVLELVCTSCHKQQCG